MERSRKRIVILGSGNVATHLALALDRVTTICQIWSRNIEHAQSLAQKLNSHPDAISNPRDICRDADVYILAVSDSVVADVAQYLHGVTGIIAHTSGSIGVESLISINPEGNYGVFYPLQTFSKDIAVNLTEVPFLIEGSNQDTLQKLYDLAKLISNNVHVADSRTRCYIHLAAVIACNFTNYLWGVSDNILQENTSYNISIIEPLLHETLRKAIVMSPQPAQTGPAIRGDLETIKKHISMLGKDHADVYRLLSEKISQTKNTSKKTNEIPYK